jgi:hypothetical protein
MTPDAPSLLLLLLLLLLMMMMIMVLVRWALAGVTSLSLHPAEQETQLSLSCHLVATADPHLPLLGTQAACSP